MAKRWILGVVEAATKTKRPSGSTCTPFVPAIPVAVPTEESSPVPLSMEYSESEPDVAFTT
jgi:hypothetical protein